MSVIGVFIIRLLILSRNLKQRFISFCSSISFMVIDKADLDALRRTTDLVSLLVFFFTVSNPFFFFMSDYFK